MLALTTNNYNNNPPPDQYSAATARMKGANQEHPSNHGNSSTCSRCQAETTLNTFSPVVTSPAGMNGSSGDLEAVLYRSGQDVTRDVPDVKPHDCGN